MSDAAIITAEQCEIAVDFLRGEIEGYRCAISAEPDHRYREQWNKNLDALTAAIRFLGGKP